MNTPSVGRSRTVKKTPPPRGVAEFLSKVRNGDGRSKILGHRMIQDFLEYLGTPRALAVWMLYSAGDASSHCQLVELTIDPHLYGSSALPVDRFLSGKWLMKSAESFRRDFAATKLLSKSTGLNTGIDLKAVAIKSAEEAELRCAETNRRLREIRSGARASGPEAVVFHHARAKIAAILGDVPSTFESVGWSKGRSTSSSGAELSSTHKYGARPDVTVNARARAVRALRDSPIWGAAVLDAAGPCSVLHLDDCTVSGNVMLTVPKSAKTDRVICYEPHMNIRLQLDVGGYIRERLRLAGVNLDDQSINQRRAKLGSKTGHLCTIDLSAASDTVALELVWELLPFEWVSLLDDLRSKYTVWPGGQVRRNEKFSSMGNGFTFELESLIFFAVCKAVSNDVTVYGDDIILPSQNFSAANAALELCGFKVNTTKSYASSHFRESCGENGFCGATVTPVYLRRPIRRLQDVVLFHNQVRRWAFGETPEPYSPPEIWASRLRTGWSRTWETVYRVPRAPNRSSPRVGDKAVAKMLWIWRDIHPHPHGPEGYGDGHYHVNFDEAAPRRATHRYDKELQKSVYVGLDGWWFTTYVRLFDEYTWGDDRQSGVFPDRLGFAALCASTGPKRPRSIWDTGADRRQERYKKHRGLCHGEWPDGLWV